MEKGKPHEQAAPMFDKIVFKKVNNALSILTFFDCLKKTKSWKHSKLFQVKEGLGGRVRLILSGAAPLAAHIESFLRVVACAHVLQGYGNEQRMLKHIKILVLIMKTFSKWNNIYFL